MANSRTRNIRKRQFDASKSLRLYRDYAALFQYLHGDQSGENELKSFEEIERIDNKDKIAEMFLKKKRNVPIPDINAGLKENASNASDDTMKTGLTKEKARQEERPPAEFYFKPMGNVTPNYIKYTPKVVPIRGNQHFDKIDYLVLRDQWEAIKDSCKGISERDKDMVEEVIDKLEKITEKGDPQPIDK